MADTKDVILNIKTNFSENIDQLARLQKELDDLKVAELQLNAAVKAGTKTREDADRELEALAAQVRNVKNEQREYRREIDNEIKKHQEAEGSIKQMRASLANLRKEYEELSKAEREGARGKELVAKIKETTDSLKELEGSQGDFRRSIGGYEEAINNALNGTVPLRAAMTSLKNSIQTLEFQFRSQGDVIAENKNKLDELASTMGKDSQEYRQQAEELDRLQKEYDETSKVLDNMKKKAGQMSDAIGDVNASITNFSKDNAGLKAATEGAQLLLNSYTALQAGMTALGIQSEELMNVYAKLQILQQGLNALNQIANSLEKESVLRQQARVLWTKLTASAKRDDAAASAQAAVAGTALSKAQVTATTTAVGLTGALKAVGAAIKSIPIIGWIAAAAALLGTIITLTVRANNESKRGRDIMMDNARAAKEYADAQREGYAEVAKSGVQLLINVEHLKKAKKGSEEWKRLVGEVSSELGVSAGWLQTNIDKVDELTSAYLKMRVAMSTSDKLIGKISDKMMLLNDIDNGLFDLFTKEGGGKKAAKAIAEQFHIPQYLADAYVDATKKYYKDTSKSKEFVDYVNAKNAIKETIENDIKELEGRTGELYTQISSLQKLFGSGSGSGRVSDTQKKAYDWYGDYADMLIGTISDAQDKEYAMAVQKNKKELDDYKKKLAEEGVEKEKADRLIVLKESELQLQLGKLRDRQAKESAEVMNDYYNKTMDNIVQLYSDRGVEGLLANNRNEASKQIDEADEKIKELDRTLDSYNEDYKSFIEGKMSEADILSKYGSLFTKYNAEGQSTQDKMISFLDKYSIKVSLLTSLIEGWKRSVRSLSDAEEKLILHNEDERKRMLENEKSDLLLQTELEKVALIESEKTRVMKEQSEERLRIAKEEYERIASERDIYTDEELTKIYGSVEAYENKVLEANLNVVKSENGVKEAVKAVEDEAQRQQAAMISAAVTVMGSVDKALGGMQNIFRALGEENDRWNAFAEATAYFQIGINLAKAIAEATANSVQGDPYTMIIRIAANVASVISAMGEAFAVYNQYHRPQYADGGLVGGHVATSRSEGRRDDVAVNVSRGEYIINADAVKRYGVGFLDSINGNAANISVTKFANGGYVSDATVMAGNYQFQMEITRQIMADAMSEIQPIVSVREITKAQNRVTLAERISKK